MLWVGLLTALATFGALAVILVMATRLDRNEYPIVGDGSLLDREDVKQNINSSHLGL